MNNKKASYIKGGAALLKGSVALRALIHRKRTSGQIASALSLAKLGRRIALQLGNKVAADEVSRKTFELYLELYPEDLEVKTALKAIAVATPARAKSLHYLAIAFVCLLLVAATLWARGYNLPSYNEPATKSLAVKAVASQSAAFASAHTSSVVHSSSLAQTSAHAALAVASVSASSSSVAAQPIVIRAVGDVVLGTNYPRMRLPDENNKKRIANLAQIFQGADVVVGNLEGVLYDQGESRKDISQASYYAFRMPESYAKTLREMGFNVLSLANNHALDFGIDGLRATKKALLAESIQASGVPGGDTAAVAVRNTTVAFLSYSYLSQLSSMHNDAQVAQDIATAKQTASIVVVTVHAGGEGEDASGTPVADEYYLNEYRGNIRKFATLAIDAGASAVFGHGPHVVRPYEVYKGQPIFFSLGNFVGFGSLSKAGKLGSSIVAEVRLSPEGRFMGAGIIPLKMDDLGIPSPDYSAKTLSLLDSLLAENLEKQPLLHLPVSVANQD